MKEDKDKIPVVEISRSKDGKIVLIGELIKYCRENEVVDDSVYCYRQSEDQEKATAWISGKELKLWAEPDEKLKKSMEMLAHYEGEKRWRRKVLDSIEPGMTSARADELKIVQQVKILDECYQLTMDGVPVGETYPMPPGMIDAIMWGKSK